MILTPRRAAALLAICAATMAAMFGWDIGAGSIKSPVLALVFALGAYFALVLLEQGLDHLRAARRDLGVMAIATWVFVIGLEIVGHVGFNATARLGDIQEATLQETAYEDSRAELAAAREQLPVFTARLQKLQEANAWLPTVTADGVRAEIANLEGDRIYTRSKQCSSVTLADSRAFCDRLADARGRLAAVEEVASLDQQIAATQALIGKLTVAARETAGETHVSAAATQGKVLASLFAQSRTVNDDQIYWSNLAFSLGTSIFMVLSGIIWAVFPAASTGPSRTLTTARPESAHHQTIVRVGRRPEAPLAVWGHGVTGIVPAGA